MWELISSAEHSYFDSHHAVNSLSVSNSLSPLPKYSHENDYNAGILSVEQESTLIIITEFRFELRKTAPGKKVILFVLVRLSGGYEVDLDTQQHVQTTQLMATVWPAEWKPTNHFRL